MISLIISTPLSAGVITIYNNTLDPSYLWFRNVTVISAATKLFIRIFIYCLSLLHSSNMVFGYGIIVFIILLIILSSLEVQTISRFKPINPTITLNHIMSIRRYRQLQIINLIFNQLLVYFLPVLTLMFLVAIAMMGYMLIKMSGIVPHALEVLVSMVTAAILGYIELGFGSMANVQRKSADFLVGLELQGGSMYRKRVLRSCKLLQIWAGSYFVMKRSTRFQLFGQMAYYVMSLVISV